MRISNLNKPTTRIGNTEAVQTETEIQNVGEPVAGSYPEQDEFSPHIPILFL